MVKTKCCRSTPRCNRCPVLLKAQMRAHKSTCGRAALVEEILVGQPHRLPASVETALLSLSRIERRNPRYV